MKALFGGCCNPVLVKGPLYSISAELTTMFMVRAERMIEMVQHVIIYFSRPCQSDLPDSVNLSLKPL